MDVWVGFPCIQRQNLAERTGGWNCGREHAGGRPDSRGLEATMRADQTAAAEKQPSYTYAKKKDTRWWEVRDPAGELVCLTVYRRGVREVVAWRFSTRR